MEHDFSDFRRSSVSWMARNPFSLAEQVNISITKLPIKGSSELFWLCAMTSYLLDLHVSSHDTVPPSKLGLALTLDLAAKFDLVFKTDPAIYLT